MQLFKKTLLKELSALDIVSINFSYILYNLIQCNNKHSIIFMNIGLFGGTFDPVHNGHIGVAECIIKQKLLDKIIFIPAACPPHKPGIPVTPFYHRVNMVNLAIERKPYFEVSEIEEKRVPLPSYTYDTVKWFYSNYPEHRFYLLIGEDSLAQIHTWYKAKELVKLCGIITYPRPKEGITLEKLKKHWPLETAKKLFKTILSLPMYEISATEIRESMKRKEDLKLSMPLVVYDYIKKHNLYSEA